MDLPFLHHLRYGELDELIEAVRVGAALGEQQLRAEGPQQGGHHGVEGAQPALVVGAGRQGEVDGRSLRALAARLGREAGAGKQRQRRLVNADREHPGIVVEHLLHAVAVMHVDVDVRDPVGTEVEQPPVGALDVVDGPVEDLAAGRLGRQDLAVEQARRQIDLSGPWRVQRAELDADLSLTDRDASLDGILREADLRNVTDDGADLSLLGEEELAFIKKCLTLGDEIAMSAATLERAVVVGYKALAIPGAKTIF